MGKGGMILEKWPAEGRALLDNLPDACCYRQIVTDSTGNPIDSVFLDINPAFTRQTGLTREEVIGKRLTELFPDITQFPSLGGVPVRAGWFDWLQISSQVARSGKPDRFEWHDAENSRWYDITVYRARPGFFVTISRDITRQKQSGEALAQVLLHLATDFINVSQEQVDSALDHMLQTVGRFTGVDRAYIFQHDFSRSITTNTHEWCADGITSHQNNLQALPLTLLNDPLNTLHTEKVFHLPRVADLPTDHPLRSHFQEQDIQSLVVLPLLQRGKTIGLVGFDVVREPRTFTETEIALLQMLAGIIANALEKREADLALKRSNAFLDSIIEHLPSMLFLKESRTLRFTRVNKKAEELLGHPRSDLLGKNDHDFFPPGQADYFTSIDRQVLQNQEAMDIPEEPIQTRDQGLRWLHTRKVPLLNDQGEAEYLLGISEDITVRKQAEKNAREAHQRLLTVLDSIDALIYVVDLSTHELLFLNRSSQQIWGNVLGQKCWQSIQINQTGPCAFCTSDKLLDSAGQPTGIYQWEHQNTRNGRWYECRGQALRWIDGRMVRLEVALDITIRKQAEEKIRHLSFHDALTGLYNRAFIEEELHRLSDSRSLPLGVVLCDVNGLKLSNDAFGHQSGDVLLQRFARVLRSACRKEDLIGRWGGDEFILLLPQSGETTVEEITSRIRQACLNDDSTPIPLSAAAGWTVRQSPTEPITATIARAEENMYRIKLEESVPVRSYILSILEQKLREIVQEGGIHLRNVSTLSEMLGQALQLRGKELEDLALLARFHDLGLINLPKTLLQKTGQLTSPEWEMVKMHPETGYRIVQCHPKLSSIAEEILTHHEHWDGSGYPRGLSGENIPLLSRIFAVIDAYDVMTTGRPYKKPVSERAALAELTRRAGSQFDPRIVEAFVESRKKKE